MGDRRKLYLLQDKFPTVLNLRFWMWIFSFILQIRFQRKRFTLMLFSFLCEPFSKGIVFRRNIRWPWVLERFMGVGSTFISWGLCWVVQCQFCIIVTPIRGFSLHSMEETGNSFSRLYFLQNTELEFANKRTHPIYKGYFLPYSWAYWRITMASRQTSEEKHYFLAADWSSW